MSIYGAENITDFNPRSRVGNDNGLTKQARYLKISIHVPAWGTTYKPLIIIIFYKISIHVPAWGTTGNMLNMLNVGFISIHVPAWGTTVLPLPYQM